MSALAFSKDNLHVLLPFPGRHNNNVICNNTTRFCNLYSIYIYAKEFM